MLTAPLVLLDITLKLEKIANTAVIEGGKVCEVGGVKKH